MLRRPTSAAGDPRVLLLVIALLLSGCGGAPDEDVAGSACVATVDEQPVSLAAFREYLQLTLGEEAAAETDAVKSALLDDFLLERLVAADAEAAGLRVSDAELEQVLAGLELDGQGTDGEGLTEAYRARLRRSLLMDRYLAEAVVGEVDVTAEEAEDGARQEDLPGGEGPLVIYRQAMTDSAEQAREILRRVRRGGESFARVAAEMSQSPDGAEPQWALVGQLPPEVSSILAGGPRGEVVGPVAVGCDEHGEGCRYYVFLIENREETGLPSVRTTADVRDALLQEKRSARLAAYRAELHRSGRIQVHPENLPFRYQANDAATEEAP